MATLLHYKLQSSLNVGLAEDCHFGATLAVMTPPKPAETSTEHCIIAQRCITTSAMRELRHDGTVIET